MNFLDLKSTARPPYEMTRAYLTIYKMTNQIIRWKSKESKAIVRAIIKPLYQWFSIIYK